MPVMDVHLPVDCLNAVLISGAVTGSALNAASSSPHGEALAVVVAPVCILGVGRATKFAAPHNQCVVQHLALLEISKESRNGAVNLRGLLLKISLQVPVRVPAAVIHLNEANALFCKAARKQALSSKVIVAVSGSDAVHLKCLGFLIRNVHEVWHFSLHAERQFVALDDAFDLVVRLITLEALLVEALHQVKLFALCCICKRTVPKVGHAAIPAVAARGAFHSHACALIDRRQESGTVVLRTTVT